MDTRVHSPWPENLRYLLGVSAGFALICVLSGVWLTPRGYRLIDPVKNPKRVEQFLAYASRDRVEDVLIIGSSRVDGGLDAPQVEAELASALDEDLSVYKLGIPGLLPQYAAGLLERAIRHRPPRRLLVLAIEARFFCRAQPIEDAGAGEPPALADEWAAEEDRAARIAAFDGLRSLWVWAWSQRPELRQSAAAIAERNGELRSLDEKHQRLRKQGSLRRRGADLFVLPEGYAWEWLEPDARAMAAWERILDQLEALPCDVLLVRMPLAKGFDAEHMPRMHARFESEIVAGARARGIDYVDLNGPPFPDEDWAFFSLTHLNAEGAQATGRVLVSEVLAPRLAGSGSGDG
ncbi:MAG: SGNH/GDSL hydrolase family protein [Planctomycetota bacterium]